MCAAASTTTRSSARQRVQRRERGATSKSDGPARACWRPSRWRRARAPSAARNRLGRRRRVTRGRSQGRTAFYDSRAETAAAAARTNLLRTRSRGVPRQTRSRKRVRARCPACSDECARARETRPSGGTIEGPTAPARKNVPTAVPNFHRRRQPHPASRGRRPRLENARLRIDVRRAFSAPAEKTQGGADQSRRRRRRPKSKDRAIGGAARSAAEAAWDTTFGTGPTSARFGALLECGAVGEAGQDVGRIWERPRGVRRRHELQPARLLSAAAPLTRR